MDVTADMVCTGRSYEQCRGRGYTDSVTIAV